MDDTVKQYDLDEEEYSSDNLPAVSHKAGLPESPELPWRVGVRPPPAPAPITHETSDSNHQDDDLNQLNHHLENTRKMFKAITSVDDFCKLTLSCAKLIELRRKAANKQWGAKEGKDSGNRGIPIDIDV